MAFGRPSPVNVCERICDPEIQELLPDKEAAQVFCDNMNFVAAGRLESLSGGPGNMETLIQSHPELEAACSQFLPYATGSTRNGLNILTGQSGLSDLETICTGGAELSWPIIIGGAIVVFLWFATYFLIFYQAQKDKRHAIPILALCFMWGYELYYTLNGSYNGNPILDVLEVAWFVIDCVLLIQVFAFYRPKLAPFPWIRAPLFQRFWPAWVVLLALTGFAGNSVLIIYFEAGPTLAYMVNLFLAISFMAFILSRPKLDGISIAAMFTRAGADVVTAAVTIAGYPFQIHFTDLCERSANNLLSTFIFIATIAVDAIAIAYLLRIRAENRRKAAAQTVGAETDA